MYDNYVFPWGVYIGKLEYKNNEIPALINANEGGFVLLFDNTNEEIVNNFIENITLTLLNVMPLNSLKIYVFDFGKKRFLYLSELGKIGIYNIAYTMNKAKYYFDELEDMVLKRYHNYLNIDTPNLNEYNLKNNTSEEFILLIINLEDFPDEMTNPKRIINFLESAYEAGVYVIAFGNKDIIDTNIKATKEILKYFPHITVTNSQFSIPEKLFKLQKLLKLYNFEYVNENKKILLNNIFKKQKEEESQSNVQDFLSIPIGKIGNESFYYNMGLKSQNYHAFIAGMTGMGKTTLLNIIIVEIAKRYTSKEIELYLMDYKPAGAEFGIFKNHPNCKKLFLNNKDLKPALEMLEYFQEEMYKRGKILNGLNIDEYNKKNPDNILPRKILIIDEVQRMFDGSWNEANRFNTLLEDLVKTGRSFGLHIILTTQSLKQINMKDSIMGQIPLKISFRLSDEIEAMKIFNENKEAIKEVVRLKPYHFVYADFHKTKIVKSDYLPKDKIVDILEEIKNQRKEGEYLIPEIVSSSNETNEESKKNIIEKENFVYKTKYTTDDAKELLAKLNSKKDDK